MYIIRFQYLLVFLFLSNSFLCVSQDQSNVVYYGKDYFILEGTEIDESLKENPYDRLPLSYKNVVRKPVWELSKNSAGISIRFFSNSTSIHVKWTLLNNLSMNHMADTGIKGIDLYFNHNGTWQYLNTARPNGVENEFELMTSMSPKMREYKMFLPLYDGVKSLEVGIDSNSTINKPKRNTSKPIIFYGTSITQGGCASRPGMAHTNIISRKLHIDCINFGFSGNGRMEEPINKLISESNPLFYVIECLPNMKANEVTTKTIPLVNTIRTKHPETPIIFVENFIYETVALNEKRALEINEKNKTLKDQYTKLIDSNVKNVFYISAKNATGIDHEGTVDGVHFTDLGFIRYADFLIDKFEKLNLISKQVN